MGSSVGSFSSKNICFKQEVTLEEITKRIEKSGADLEWAGAEIKQSETGYFVKIEDFDVETGTQADDIVSFLEESKDLIVSGLISYIDKDYQERIKLHFVDGEWERKCEELDED